MLLVKVTGHNAIVEYILSRFSYVQCYKMKAHVFEVCWKQSKKERAALCRAQEEKNRKAHAYVNDLHSRIEELEGQLWCAMNDTCSSDVDCFANKKWDSVSGWKPYPFHANRGLSN